jgi:hypothetical protein
MGQAILPEMSGGQAPPRLPGLGSVLNRVVAEVCE